MVRWHLSCRKWWNHIIIGILHFMVVQIIPYYTVIYILITWHCLGSALQVVFALFSSWHQLSILLIGLSLFCYLFWCGIKYLLHSVNMLSDFLKAFILWLHNQEILPYWNITYCWFCTCTQRLKKNEKKTKLITWWEKGETVASCLTFPPPYKQLYMRKYSR